MRAQWVLAWALFAAAALGLAPLARARGAEEATPALSASSAPPSKDFTDNLPCSACHSTISWRAKGAAAGQKFDHAQTGFPLTGEHAATPCVDCHDAKTKIKRACVSCHEDAHRGRLSQSCDRCHSAAGWKVTRPLELHRMTRFPLTGMHVLADCTECHRRANEQVFTDAPVACFACHERDYRRPANFPVHVGTASTPPLPRDCSLCHRAIAWVPASPVGASAGTTASALSAAPPMHDLRFPISFGVHRMAACPDCHVSRAVPRAVRCIGCHAHDPVQIAAQHRVPVATDGAACLACHVAGGRR
jgi:hypothetical protein